MFSKLTRRIVHSQIEHYEKTATCQMLRKKCNKNFQNYEIYFFFSADKRTITKVKLTVNIYRSRPTIPGIIEHLRLQRYRDNLF
jgi:hypothetical protein